MTFLSQLTGAARVWEDANEAANKAANEGRQWVMQQLELKIICS